MFSRKDSQRARDQVFFTEYRFSKDSLRSRNRSIVRAVERTCSLFERNTMRRDVGRSRRGFDRETLEISLQLQARAIQAWWIVLREVPRLFSPQKDPMKREESTESDPAPLLSFSGLAGFRDKREARKSEDRASAVTYAACAVFTTLLDLPICN